jgi:hypothetical protein
MDTPITAAHFKEMWNKAGNKTNAKGRPILPPMDGLTQSNLLNDKQSKTSKKWNGQTKELASDLKGQSPGSLKAPLPNKKVRNAKKQFDHNGEKIADSKWELQCLRMLEMAGLKPEKQRAFEILPTTRDRGLKRTLGKRSWHPDFTFDDLRIVADAKGWITEMARIKIQLFLFRYFQWEVYQLKNEADVYELIQIIKERRKS